MTLTGQTSKKPYKRKFQDCSTFQKVMAKPFVSRFEGLLFTCEPSAFPVICFFRSFWGDTFTGFDFRIISNNPSSVRIVVLHAERKKIK